MKGLNSYSGKYIRVIKKEKGRSKGMCVGNGGQIYKEAEKQQLIHVEEEQTQQSQKQGQSQPEQMQQKTDRLEHVMQKYQENTSQIDLSEVKKDQSADMEEQIVVTTSIHETKNAELILGGEQLPQKKQEQISRAEQQMQQEVQSGQHAMRIDEDEEKYCDIRAKLLDIQKAFDEDTDSSSQTFTQVKTTLNRLWNEMGNDDKDDQALSNALLACRNAAVHYYNTHRGHRWSDKGKRRKDLVNQLIDATHDLLVNKELPEDVRYPVIHAMLKDTSDTGFESKKSKEFFRAQAKKESRYKAVDEYSYMIRHSNLMHEALRKKDLDDLDQMEGMDPVSMIHRILKYKITPEVLTPKYIMMHYVEIKQLQTDKAILLDLGVPLNYLKRNFAELEQQLENRFLLLEMLDPIMQKIALGKGVNEQGFFDEDNIDAMGGRLLLSFEELKNTQLIHGDQFQKLVDDYIERRKTGRKNQVEDDSDDEEPKLVATKKEASRLDKLANRAAVATTEKVNRWSKKQLLTHMGIENLPEEVIDRYNA